jgi:hypothetical protein
MPDRFNLALKAACLTLAALVLYELARFVSRWNPLGAGRVPALPTLTLTAATGGGSGGKTASPIPVQDRKPTNAGTDAVSSAKAVKPQTNAAATRVPDSTPTNAIPSKGPTAARPGPPTRPGMPMKGPELDPAVQARVDRIAQSEIIAPFIRPLPMALLGIAGDSAFLRAPNGQTGVIKEGSELGGLKLLRIGTNRVLVEQDGQPKELMVFSGYGGESLLPKTNAQSQ